MVGAEDSCSTHVLVITQISLVKFKISKAEAPHICAQCRPVVHVSWSVLRTRKQGAA